MVVISTAYSYQMPVRNRIKEFVDGKGITRYQFYKDTGISPGTAYSLYDNPELIPQVTVLNKVCDYYKIQPSELIYWVDPEEIERSQKKKNKKS